MMIYVSLYHNLGPTATRNIRSLGYRGIILGVTGNAYAADTKTFLDSGIDAIILKPLRLTEFDATMSCLLAKEDGKPSTIL